MTLPMGVFLGDYSCINTVVLFLYWTNIKSGQLSSDDAHFCGLQGSHCLLHQHRLFLHIVPLLRQLLQREWAGGEVQSFYDSPCIHSNTTCINL